MGSFPDGLWNASHEYKTFHMVDFFRSCELGCTTPFPPWVLLILWFSSAVHRRIPIAASAPPAPPPFQVPTPNSLAPLSPFIPVSSSSVSVAANLFIKQMSGICQSPGRSQGDWFIHPPCDSYNDQLSVVFLPRLPHISISCHCSVQRINLSAQTYSSLSDLSPH